MTDISITPGSVLADSGASTTNGTAGATITAGQVVYLDATDGEFKLADSDSATAAVRSPYGIALNGASDGQPLAVLRRGPITIGGTMTAGLAYYLSKATPGGICPVADIASGGYSVILGIATSTTVLDVKIQESGVAV
jgi:hypothetical protein